MDAEHGKLPNSYNFLEPTSDFDVSHSRWRNFFKYVTHLKAVIGFDEQISQAMDGLQQHHEARIVIIGATNRVGRQPLIWVH
jgi:hypothetical protein